MKWAGHRNLRLRPPAPAKGRGRLQRQVARACIAAGTPIVYSSIFMPGRMRAKSCVVSPFHGVIVDIPRRSCRGTQ